MPIGSHEFTSLSLIHFCLKIIEKYMYLLAQKKKMNSRSIGSVCTELHSKFYYTMLFLVLTTDCNNSSSSTKFVATVLYAKATYHSTYIMSLPTQFLNRPCLA